MKKILANVLVIMGIVALTATATWAYFGGTATNKVTVATANIAIDDVTGFPIKFEGLLPGRSQTQEVAVKNIGNEAADFYVQLVSDPASGNANFCATGGNLMRATIEEWTGSAWEVRYSDDMCRLFPGWSLSVIPRVADDVPADAQKAFRVTVTLDPDAGNDYMNKWTTSTINMIAVQYDLQGGLIADTRGGHSALAWPESDDRF